MAGQQRSTTFAQESTRPLTQVALYARVGTLNNQDPEMHSPNCGSMQGAVAGRLLRNSQTRTSQNGRSSRPGWRRTAAGAESD